MTPLKVPPAAVAWANALGPADNDISRERFARKPHLSPTPTETELTDWLVWYDPDGDYDGWELQPLVEALITAWVETADVAWEDVPDGTALRGLAPLGVRWTGVKRGGKAVPSATFGLLRWGSIAKSEFVPTHVRIDGYYIRIKENR